MRVCSFKSGGRAHRTWLDVAVTNDAWTFYVPPGGRVEEADGSHWSSDFPVLLQFWPDRYYQVCVLLKPGGTEYYCNVIVPPVYQPEVQMVSFVDLELDVLVTSAGVHLLDEAEFAENRAGFDDPLWGERAEQAAAELAEMAEAKTGPFSPAALRGWLDWLESRENSP